MKLQIITYFHYMAYMCAETKGDVSRADCDLFLTYSLKFYHS